MIHRIVMVLAVLFSSLMLGACSQSERSDLAPANPAIWEIRGANGALGWLFGTVHKLPGDREWRSEELKHALAAADILVVETRDVNDKARMRAVFERLSHTPRQRLLTRRIAPEKRGALLELLHEYGLSERDFADTETWAAALTLAQLASASRSETGVDGALLQMDGPSQVVELEGTKGQLSIFDRLPEKEQRDLLGAVVAVGDRGQEVSQKLIGFWSKGDMASIARETHRGMLADPELRDRLLVRRNRAWAKTVDAMLRAGQRPFVAAGAAHMAGEDGLPALLAARGWQVLRIQ